MVWLWVGLGILGLIALFIALAAIGGGVKALQMATQPAEGGINFLAASTSMLMVLAAWLRVLIVLMFAIIVLLIALIAPVKAAEPYTGTDVKAMKQYCRAQAREALAHDDVKDEIKLYMWCVTDWFLAHPDVYAGHF
ncbi:hypothetical protein KGP36_05895 [Patescibacteria group bacterium]|nr:hypothetical protein [Patescibacteria group bacterium]